MADNVNHPAHYETGKFECIDVMVETQGVEATQDFSSTSTGTKRKMAWRIYRKQSGI